ncbi:MAG: anthranilate phosphoribosyltransferase, partial [Verrucomicrobiota bacterium]
EQAAECLEKHRFAFFFAPKFHPAFRHIAPARKLCAARGQRTMFNLLGPLLNPARPSAQLIGVPNPKFCEPVAKVLQLLGVRRGMVVSGNAERGTRNGKNSAFLDEFSTLGENFVAEFYQERALHTSVLSPENFPLQKTSLEDLAGGDSVRNAEIVREIFSGKERGQKRDAVLLNAAAALFVAGKTKNFSDGWEMAAALLDEGQAAQKLADLIQFCAKTVHQ